MSARYAVRDGIAVITLDNPPVNALSADTRRDLVTAVDAAEQDEAVSAIVIIGSGRMFGAGADITELGTPRAEEEPTLPTVVEAVESSDKPVVAAMHAAALGGGLELALAAHVGRLELPKRPVAQREIVERLVFALIDEGARVLEEGIAARASDIDLVYLNGYGFPGWRGGPMFYADTVGPYNVLRRIRRFSRGYQGESWTPAAPLCRLAESGGRLNS